MKWYGKIGFAETVEKEKGSGVWIEKITEHSYFGDVIRNNRRLQSSDQLNDNINVSNSISVISDPYANENFHAIRYIEFMGSNWKVSDVDVQFPRLILTVGGLYNGE